MRFDTERTWKKVYESDVEYVAIECKDHLPHQSVLILEGDVGAGKTTFVKHFANDPESSSPSYNVINEYPDVLHADFYRIKESSEIIHLELSLYMDQRPYICIEWGLKHIRRIENELPDGFTFYVLQIDINEMNYQKVESRNYTLKKITEI